ncbi:20549_t:CDS:2, partial [Dentiscutata erythropus]
LSNVKKMKRKICGKKGDGYVRTFGSRPVEWAASESGPQWEGEYGTKLTKERGLSLPKTLKDIFVDLARKVNFREDKIRQISVPGFVHAGAVLIKTRIDCPKGYVCRYVREEPYEIYADVSQFNKTLDALMEILHTMEIINSSSNDDNITRWKNRGNFQKIEIPDCHYTPKKK